MNAAQIDKNTLTLPCALIIMDGFGLAEPGAGNAISLAETPTLDELFKTRPWTQLQASGNAVGLPEGQMGNSEVGHLNIGAGRVVFQELTRINMACEDGTLAHNPVLQQAFEQARGEGHVLHLMGLLSNGGVHSSNQHLYALMRAAKEAGVPSIFVHCFMDGRDVAPTSGVNFIDELAAVCASLSDESCQCTIASIAGRYYAMDRDKRWGRVEQAYDALVTAVPLTDKPAHDVMEDSYADGVTDEFVVPVALQDRGMVDGDSVIFFNFRPDRAREITRALVDEDFDGFMRAKKPAVHVVCLTEYDPTIDAPVAFAKEFPEEVLADVLAEAGLTQYHIAETEKYAHVTFFFNGGRETPFDKEDRILVPSPKVATYDLKPEMSAFEVKDKLVAAINENKYDFIVVNFANGDMVGHTGIYEAIEKAVIAVDACVKDVIEAAKAQDYEAIIIADHGNADHALNEDGTPNTAHSLNPVPCVYVTENKAAKVENGRLADVAPTILKIMGLAAPAEMDGNVLIK